MVDYDFDEQPSSKKIPLIVVIARVVTLASLLISSLVLYNNEVTTPNGGVLNYKFYDTYGFVFGVMITGTVYSVLLVPFAVYHLIAKKQLIDHQAFLLFQVVGDKMMFGLLATAAGASLGVTVEFQKSQFGNGMDSKMHGFIGFMYVPNAFLVVGIIASLITSIMSSLTLRE